MYKLNHQDGVGVIPHPSHEDRPGDGTIRTENWRLVPAGLPYRVEKSLTSHGYLPNDGALHRLVFGLATGQAVEDGCGGAGGATPEAGPAAHTHTQPSAAQPSELI